MTSRHASRETREAKQACVSAGDLVPTAPGISVITRAIEEVRRIFEHMNSYAIYRIAETMRLVLFMTATIAERQSARARLRRYPTLLRDGA